MILLRGFGSCELRVGNDVLPVARLTQQAGVAALYLECLQSKHTQYFSGVNGYFNSYWMQMGVILVL
jgi:hypothetical protein